MDVTEADPLWPSVLDQEFVLLLWSGFRPVQERLAQQRIWGPLPAVRLRPVRRSALSREALNELLDALREKRLDLTGGGQL